MHIFVSLRGCGGYTGPRSTKRRPDRNDNSIHCDVQATKFPASASKSLNSCPFLVMCYRLVAGASSGSSGLDPGALGAADFLALPESPDVTWLRFARQKGAEPDARFECDTATDQCRALHDTWPDDTVSAASRQVADNAEPQDIIVERDGCPS